MSQVRLHLAFLDAFLFAEHILSVTEKSNHPFAKIGMNDEFTCLLIACACLHRHGEDNVKVVQHIIIHFINLCKYTNVERTVYFTWLLSGKIFHQNSVNFYK